MSNDNELDKLTPKQEQAFQFLFAFQKETGSYPTIRELCKHMGYRAIGSAQDVIAALRRKGYIMPPQDKKRRARSYALTEKGRKHLPISGDFDDEEGGGYMIPCLGAVPAGNPLEAIEERIGTLHVSTSLVSHPRPKKGSLFALKAQGLSMIHAGILDGDWLIVQSQQRAASGKIVVARIDGDVTVKRLQKDRKGWFLKPENPDFTDIYAKDQPFEIIGKVVALQRAL